MSGLSSSLYVYIRSKHRFCSLALSGYPLISPSKSRSLSEPDGPVVPLPCGRFSSCSFELDWSHLVLVVVTTCNFLGLIAYPHDFCISDIRSFVPLCMVTVVGYHSKSLTSLLAVSQSFISVPY